MPDERAIGALVRSVAGYGLVPAFRLTVGDHVWPGVLGTLSAQRLTGLAFAAVEAGSLQLAEPQRAMLVDRHREAMVRCLRLEATLLQLVDAFDAAALQLVVLKGPALARSAYPDPSWRSYGDLDVLVPAREWQQACAVLESEGFRRRLPEPRPGFDVRFGKGGPFVDAQGLEVDLHRTLVSGPFGAWIDADLLFERTTTFPLAGRPLRRLDDEATLLHACLHASLGSTPPRLLPVRDLAQALDIDTLDWGAVERLAETWRSSSVIRHAFGLVHDLLGVELPGPARRLVAVQAPSRLERRALRAYVDGSLGWGAKAMAQVSAIPGFRKKVAFVWALAFPTREFLRARAVAGGQGSYLRRWAVPLRWVFARRRGRLAWSSPAESLPVSREGVDRR